ncbi:MAG: hypothetical protein D6816_19080 [Bacteroidetes bacterium]|nr:MAG: hypothetical protein D6816_19080 [Bacteroidota bacterium]
MSNGELFLKRFNELEHALRERAGLGPDASFTDLVKTAAEKDSTVRRRKEILRSIGRLRNAIVHDRQYPERILADPRKEVIEELESVLAAIIKPKTLIPTFQRSIHIFTAEDALADCLGYMKEHDFSQVVLNLDGKHMLLSSEGIVKWLENARDVGLADLEQATVRDAWEYENKNICQYLPRNAPIDAVYEAFEQAIGQGIPRLQAVLITHSGRPEERPLGIVTPWDLLSKVP